MWHAALVSTRTASFFRVLFERAEPWLFPDKGCWCSSEGMTERWGARIACTCETLVKKHREADERKLFKRTQRRGPGANKQTNKHITVLAKKWISLLLGVYLMYPDNGQLCSSAHTLVVWKEWIQYHLFGWTLKAWIFSKFLYYLLTRSAL